MPVKKDAFKPRVYPKKEAKGIVFYILHWVGGKRKFHRAHDGHCQCGKPRPNRPCRHLEAAQRVLLTFAPLDEPIDAPVDYLVHRWTR